MTRFVKLMSYLCLFAVIIFPAGSEDELPETDEPEKVKTSHEIPKSAPDAAEMSEIGPDNFWIFYQRALKVGMGKRTISLPLPGASETSKLELVVDDDLKRYVIYDQKTLLQFEIGIKAVILGISGYDELRMPLEKPRFIVRLGENELSISDLSIASREKNAEDKQAENIEFMASPLLPSGIKEFSLDGKFYPTSFSGTEFRDPDARIIYFFSGENYDFYVRYKFTPTDKMAGLDDTIKYSYLLADKTGSLTSKIVSASSSKGVLIKCNSSQFKCMQMIEPYFVELKENMREIRNKIIKEADGIAEITDKLDNPAELKSFMSQQQKNIDNSISAKKREIEKLQSSNNHTASPQKNKKMLDGATMKKFPRKSKDSRESDESNYQKITRLENEIYNLQNSVVKFSDRYFMDLVDEYAEKSSLMRTEPLKRIKEDGKMEEFESILSADLNGAEFMIVSKTGGIRLKRLKITNK